MLDDLGNLEAGLGGLGGLTGLAGLGNLGYFRFKISNLFISKKSDKTIVIECFMQVLKYD